MKTGIKLEIKEYRKKWAIFAGKSKMATGFKTKEAAEKDLNMRRKTYEYYAGSAGVSVENTDPTIIHV